MEFKSNYSCNTASETLEWINAIVKFLKPYKFFFQANVVNFLKDRLWEAVDEDWIDCLKHEHVEHLLQIPSGIVQDHWPASLKEYVLTAKLLAFPRERAKLEKELPGISMTSLNCVLSQGMNPKKKHEVEVLSSLVSCITRNMGAHTVIDVGAGQLPVVAIDASSHHGAITNIRAERIKKHYAAKLHNSGKGLQNMPITMTCRVLSSSMLRNLSNYCCQQDGFDKNHKIKGSNQISPARFEAADLELPSSGNDSDCESSLVLAGLHACGDLSVTMLSGLGDGVGFYAGKTGGGLGCWSGEREQGAASGLTILNVDLRSTWGGMVISRVGFFGGGGQDGGGLVSRGPFVSGGIDGGKLQWLYKERSIREALVGLLLALRGT
uniref:Uncharacterized protein n=1 Tax=Chenopodium quinoa TaxID=63459 RepID=A0A803N821_CHEQI